MDLDGLGTEIDQGGGDPDESAEDGNQKGKKDVVCTLVAGCSKLVRFCMVHTHTKKIDVPSQVLFNPNTLQFFTLAGNDIHIWDASLGTHVHSFWNIFEASGRAENIECMCFDTRRRKIIAGSEGGQLYVFNSVSGTSMKGIKAHNSAIVSVHYADRCRCIVSAGTDRRILVHDESGDNLMLLRAVSNLHPRSIDCCSFSEEFSQIATGSSGGMLRVVDFEKLVLRSDFVMPLVKQKESKQEDIGGATSALGQMDATSSRGNVTAIVFATKRRPLLISCMSDGVVAVWPLQLTMREPGASGIVGPLMTFHLLDFRPAPSLDASSTEETGRTSMIVEPTKVKCCFTAMAISVLGEKHKCDDEDGGFGQNDGEGQTNVSAAEDATNESRAENENETETNTNTKNTSSSASPASRCEMLVLADDDGFLNEISLQTIFEHGNVMRNVAILPHATAELPYNHKDYNSKLRYAEYEYLDLANQDESEEDESSSDTEDEEGEDDQEYEEDDDDIGIERDKDKEEEEEKEKGGRKDEESTRATFLTATHQIDVTDANPLMETSPTHQSLQIGILPERRWSAHEQSIVTVTLTSTPPLILTGSEDECVHVFSFCPPGLDTYGKAIKIKEDSTDLDKTKEMSVDVAAAAAATAAAKAFGDPTREEFYGALSHHKARDDDPFDEWHLPLDGLDLTSQHNKAAEKLLAEAERDRQEQLLREQHALKRSLELNTLRDELQREGLLVKRAQSKEVLSAHKHAESRTNAQKTALHDAMMQVKDENTLEIPTWGDFFQEITENKDEKAFSETSLIKGSLAGYFGGEEVERLRMIRKHGMHHIYSFFPPAIDGADDPMPLEPQIDTDGSDTNKKSSPAVYLNFRAERARRGDDVNASKKQRDLEKALEFSRPSKFLLKQLGPKKRRQKVSPMQPLDELSRGTSHASSTPFFLTPLPSMISAPSMTASSSLTHGEGSSSFFLTEGVVPAIIGSHDSIGNVSAIHSASTPRVGHRNAPHGQTWGTRTSLGNNRLNPLRQNRDSTRRQPMQNASVSATLKRPRRRPSSYGSTLAELQARVDGIMDESDEIAGRAEIEAAAKAARLESTKKRKAKKGRRASLVSSSKKADDIKKKEDAKKTKQNERDKQKKIDSRNRAWSKAGASKREVLEIINSFNSLDEDLTGEIDPREFFSLPAFSGFASESAMETLFRAIDRDGSGTVTQEELLTVMFPMATKSDVKEMVKMARESRFGKKQKKKKVSRLSEKQRADIETIFKIYDTDGSNSVDLTELLAALGESLRNIMTSAEIAAIFAKFDKDGNADLELDEFIKLYEDYFLDSVEAAQGPPGY
jgi:Ca2+-binding EF-hand superfamily protein